MCRVLNLCQIYNNFQERGGGCKNRGDTACSKGGGNIFFNGIAGGYLVLVMGKQTQSNCSEMDGFVEHSYEVLFVPDANIQGVILQSN